MDTTKSAKDNEKAIRLTDTSLSSAFLLSICYRTVSSPPSSPKLHTFRFDLGKSMLAQRLPTILPPLTPVESLETTRIYSAMGRLPAGEPLLKRRPFRTPHHTISDDGMVGGGTTPSPGEISLAHHGVLFLDELPEFHRRSLEVLRQPQETGK
jgi:hypothetical protein